MNGCSEREARRMVAGHRVAGHRVALVAAWLAAVLPTGAALLGPSAAFAQESEAHQYHPAAQEAISKIRSPFCPGQTLEICPSWQAEVLRDSIDEWASSGLTADSLIELVVATHGEEYRGFPQRSGTGLLAWVMPPAALVLGLGLVVLALRRLRGPARPAVEQSGLTEQEREQLDTALAELEAMEDAE